MTINSTTRKTSSLVGNGNTHTYPFAFKVFTDADVVVKKLEAATSVETTLTLGASNDYIVTLSADQDSNPGGSITLKASGSNYNLPSGFSIVITSAVTPLQGTDLTNQGGFYPEVINDALDKAIILHQQQQDEIDRTIKFSLTNTIGSLEITENAAARKNKVISFDNAGELSVLKELGTYRGNWAASTSYVVRDLVKDTSTSNIFYCNTAHTSSGAQPLTTNTHSANWDLIVDAATAATSSTAAATSATAAATSATAAATSATAAASSATAAASSASTASTKATEATTAKTAAETAKTAAETAKTAAETALDSFDDRYLGVKSSNPTLDNDGAALLDGALYFNGTSNIMRVYDLGNTAWLDCNITGSNLTNVNTVAGAIANVNLTGGSIANVNTVATNISNVNAVAGDIAKVVVVANDLNETVSEIETAAADLQETTSEIDTVANAITNVDNVGNNIANVNTVAGISANVTTVAGNNANVTTVAGAITNVNNVGGSIANVNTCATNLSGINSFAARYRTDNSGSNPSSDNDAGDLFYNQASEKLLVYNGTTSAWEETQTVGSFFINTLAAFSGTGGNGTGQFDGTAYKFTLSNAGQFAQQMIVSVNGVIQKPNSGTGQPSEGFALDGANIVFSSPPANNAPFFIITIGASVSIGTPSDETITLAKFVHGTSGNDGKYLRSNNGADPSWESIPAGVGGATGVDFNDEVKARWGTNNDGEIYYDETNDKFRIAMVTGSGNPIELTAQNIYLQGVAGAAYSAKFSVQNGQELFFGGTKKFETTTNGITVTGRIDAAADSTHDIGTNGVRFANGYFDTLYGDGSNLTGISGGVDSDGTNNTVAGENAGNAGTWSGLGGNNCFGENAGTDLTTGTYNHCFGYQAGSSITSGNYNIAIGFEALKTTTTGGGNIAIGQKAMNGGDITGANNVAVGLEALKGISGNVNGCTAVGYRAGYSASTTDGQLTAFGFEACKTVGTGIRNCGIGYQALLLTSSGGMNTALGYKAGNQINTGGNNTCLGHEAANSLQNGGHNTIVGYNAAYDLTTGSYNVCLGSEAGADITTGGNNVALGRNALRKITTRSSMVAVGLGALENNDTGYSNTAVGMAALNACDDGYQNCAVGEHAGRYITSGDYNSCFGRYGGAGITTGNNNIAIGPYALMGTCTGNNNNAVGYQALTAVTSGHSNQALGFQAGDSIITGYNNVCLGHGSDTTSDASTNQFVLGNTSISLLRCQVTSITSLSDERDKTDITNLPLGLDFLNKLRPVKFKWNSREGMERDGSYEAGFIAQELKKVEDDEGVASWMKLVHDENPERLEATPGSLLPVLVNAIKELSAKNTALEARLTTLEAGS